MTDESTSPDAAPMDESNKRAGEEMRNAETKRGKPSTEASMSSTDEMPGRKRDNTTAELAPSEQQKKRIGESNKNQDADQLMTTSLLDPDP
eukprot:4580656-Amphidinium_carterae.1